MFDTNIEKDARNGRLSTVISGAKSGVRVQCASE
jgi:hypothetical protein